MGLQPNLSGRSVEIDLRGIQEGTHPLVLDGRGASLTIDAAASQRLHGYRFEGTLTFEGQDCRVRGSLSGALETACDRCLARFDREVRAELDTRVVVSRLAPEERGERETSGSVVDLTDSLREAVFLEIPIKNLCSGECRGICPRCGVNRNVESCDCGEAPGDPRWSALEGLSFPSDPEE
jgi:uncharacterized protein